MKLSTFFLLYLSVIAVSCIIILAMNKPKEPKLQYQLIPYQDSMTLMDGNRLVGRLPYDSSLLSKTIELDNQ